MRSKLAPHSALGRGTPPGWAICLPFASRPTALRFLWSSNLYCLFVLRPPGVARRGCSIAARFANPCVPAIALPQPILLSFWSEASSIVLPQSILLSFWSEAFSIALPQSTLLSPLGPELPRPLCRSLFSFRLRIIGAISTALPRSVLLSFTYWSYLDCFVAVRSPFVLEWVLAAVVPLQLVFPSLFAPGAGSQLVTGGWRWLVIGVHLRFLCASPSASLWSRIWVALRPAPQDRRHCASFLETTQSSAGGSSCSPCSVLSMGAGSSLTFL